MKRHEVEKAVKLKKEIERLERNIKRFKSAIFYSGEYNPSINLRGTSQDEFVSQIPAKAFIPVCKLSLIESEAELNALVILLENI